MSHGSTPLTDLPTLQRRGAQVQTQRRTRLHEELVTLTTQALLEYERQTGRTGATGQAVQYRRYDDQAPRRLLAPRREVLIEDAAGLRITADARAYEEQRPLIFLDAVTREELFLTIPETLEVYALKGRQTFHLQGVAQTELVYGPRFGLNAHTSQALQNRRIWRAPALLVLLLTLNNALTLLGAAEPHLLLLCTTVVSVAALPLMLWWGFRPQEAQLQSFGRALVRRLQGQVVPERPVGVNRPVLVGLIVLAFVLSWSHVALAGSLVQALSIFLTWTLLRFFQLQAEQHGQGLAGEVLSSPLTAPGPFSLSALTLIPEERQDLAPKVAQLQVLAQEAQAQVATAGLDQPQYRALSAVQREWPESVALIAALPPQHQAQEAARHLELLLDISQQPAQGPVATERALAAHLTYLQGLQRDTSLALVEQP